MWLVCSFRRKDKGLGIATEILAIKLVELTWKIPYVLMKQHLSYCHEISKYHCARATILLLVFCPVDRGTSCEIYRNGIPSVPPSAYGISLTKTIMQKLMVVWYKLPRVSTLIPCRISLQNGVSCCGTQLEQDESDEVDVLAERLSSSPKLRWYHSANFGDCSHQVSLIVIFFTKLRTWP